MKYSLGLSEDEVLAYNAKSYCLKTRFIMDLYGWDIWNVQHMVVEKPIVINQQLHAFIPI